MVMTDVFEDDIAAFALKQKHLTSLEKLFESGMGKGVVEEKVVAAEAVTDLQAPKRGECSTVFYVLAGLRYTSFWFIVGVFSMNRFGASVDIFGMEAKESSNSQKRSLKTQNPNRFNFQTPITEGLHPKKS